MLKFGLIMSPTRERLPGNGDDPVKTQLYKELEIAGLIVFDFIFKSNTLRRESRITIPSIPPEIVQMIRQKLAPIMDQANPVQANKALELGLNDLVLNLARDFEEMGQNFRIGAGFACLVFKELVKEDLDFPPVSQTITQSFEQNYHQALTKFAESQKIPIEDHQTRVAFIKGMLLFGFLAPLLYEKENLELLALFRSFGTNRPFATEGAILVYQLKTDQYLLDHKPKN